MNPNLFAHRVLLPPEPMLALLSIKAVWCYENRDNDMFVLDISHLREHEEADDVADLYKDAVKAVAVLDNQPSCIGWRKLDLLQIAPE